MYTTDHPPSKPPDPHLPEARIACPDCGADCRRAWRRGHDGVFRAYAVCTHCGGLVCALRDRPPRDADKEELAKDAMEILDDVCDRAVSTQRHLQARLAGLAPLPLAHVRAIHAAALTALATLSPENLERIEAKLTEQARGQTARFRGWHRRSKRDRWQAVVSADSEASAWQQMLSAVAGGDKTVAMDGVDPNEQRRPR
jgi:ribosomal protein S10